jgi:ribosomal protein L16 Arg81 hydroxylase
MKLESLFPGEDLHTAWPAKPLLHHHGPGAFDHLLTLQQVDDLIDHDCLPMGNVAILQDNRPVDDRLYVGEQGLPRRGAVRAYLDAGATLSVRGMERLFPRLAELRDEYQEQTGYLTHINAYYTPPGQQGLKYHYDPYATLVLQISGAKVWPFHEPFVENPVQEFESFHTRGFTEEEKEILRTTKAPFTQILTPGDAFFLPRGYPHSPFNGTPDEPSLHITIALKERPRVWFVRQLLAEVEAQAIQRPDMRVAVRPSRVTDDPMPAVEDAVEWLLGALQVLPKEDFARRIVHAARTER